VAITGRTEDSLEEARAALSAIAGKDNVVAVAGDMTRSADIARALDRPVATVEETEKILGLAPQS
jgi:hypothetical protein